MKAVSIIVFVVISLLGSIRIHSFEREKDYLGESIADALTDLIRKNPEINISFIYDILENYKVKGKMISDVPVEAIRQLVGLNPISVREKEGIIYVEAMQRGDYRYTGQIVEPSGSPVEFATVILLNPRDSTAITYGLSDSAGFFSIPCDRRKVIAKVSSTGYKTRFVTPLSFSLGKVELEILLVNLAGITATSESRYTTTDKTVFIPSAREKNAAQSGMELLMFMAIPSLKISIVNKSLSTLGGQTVATFIDYLPASSEDLGNMKPSDVKRVEILDYPADPRFGGVAHAVNFITQRYEYGGYTKLLAQQTLDFGYGYYSLSSKFSHGKMTYDLFTGYDHFKSDKEGSSSVADYDFGNHAVELRQTTPESLIENNEAYISTRARYASKKTTISNQLSLRRNDIPHSRVIRDNIYSPAIYPDDRSVNSSTRKSLNPSWSGNYYFTLPRSLRLVVTPSAKYADNSSNTFFSENGTDIINDVSEKAWNANLGATLTKTWTDFSLTTGISGELSSNKLRYAGENPADVNYSFRALGARVSGNLKFGRLWIQPSAKFYFSRTVFDGEKFHQPLPGYYLAAGIDLGRKQSLSVSSEMSQWTIGVADRSPNIVVKSLLDAVRGNPDVKTSLCKSFSGDYQEIAGGISAVARFFSNSLTLQGTLDVSSFRRGGLRRFHRNAVNGSLSAVYYLKDFYMMGSYDFRQRKASVNTNIIDQPSYSLFRAGWSNGRWNLSADIRNPFRSHRLKLREYASYLNFTKQTDYYGDAYRRRIWITAVFTISYGKKLKESDIDRGSTVSSGIVN